MTQGTRPLSAQSNPQRLACGLVLVLLAASGAAMELSSPASGQSAAPARLLDMADASLSSTPPEIEPWLQFQIAAARAALTRSDPSPAGAPPVLQRERDDAFLLALALGSTEPSPTGYQSTVVELVKKRVELGLVRQLAAARPAAALGYLRAADVPKGELYDALIQSSVRPAAAARAGAAVEPLPLIQEAAASGGSFPYLGTELFFADTGAPSTDRIQALRLGLLAAGNETRAPGMTRAASFLLAGYGELPAYGSELTPVALALLRRITAVEATRPTSGASAGARGQLLLTARRLVSLLIRFDPARAGEYSAQFPLLTAPLDRRRRQAPTPAAAKDSGAADGPSSYSALSGLEREAAQLARNDPTGALVDAERAKSLLTPAVLSTEGGLLICARLTTTLERLDSNAVAAELIAGCLAAAQTQDRKLARRFDAGDDSEKARIELRTWLSPETPDEYLMAVAMSIVPSQAARAAEEWPTPVERIQLLALAASHWPNPR